MNPPAIQLKILLPSEIFLTAEVWQVIAEAENGQFCLLPHHVDFVASLVPGLLTYKLPQKQDPEKQEHLVAIDEGTLVKCGYEVLVSTRNAVAGKDLGSLERVVEEQFLQLDDREKLARSASAQLEASLVRRFMELERI